MEEQIIFRCYECGQYFRSSDAGITMIEERFCYRCGGVFEERVVNVRGRTSEVDMQGRDLAQCTECAEDLKNRIIAVCPKCHERNVKIQGTISK